MNEEGGQEDGKIVTLDVFTKAIAHKIGIDEKDARHDANFVMDIFGFGDRIIDNVLEPEDRQLFYILEEEEMLRTEREENTLYDGREWRTHYWLFNKEAIFRYASSNEPKDVNEGKSIEEIYASFFEGDLKSF
jgi:hypothetical protein